MVRFDWLDAIDFACYECYDGILVSFFDVSERGFS